MKPTLKEKILSRNYLNFVISATIATLVFWWLVQKCERAGVFDHLSAANYYNIWGNTIVLFSVVFFGRDMGKHALDVLSKKKDGQGSDGVV